MAISYGKNFMAIGRRAARLRGVMDANVTITASTTETQIVATPVLQPSDCKTDMMFRAMVAGELTTPGATQGDLTVQLRYKDATVVDVVAVTFDPAASQSNAPFIVHFYWRLHTISGTASKVVGHAWGRLEEGTAEETIVDTAATGVTIDTTQFGLSPFDITLQWSNSTASQTVIATQAIIEACPVS